MKVKELIVMLEKYDENLEVVCVTQDESLVDINQSYKMLEINAIESTRAKFVTAKDKLPSVKLRQSSAVPEMQVVIEMTGGLSAKSQYTQERRRGIDRRSSSRSFGYRA